MSSSIDWTLAGASLEEPDREGHRRIVMLFFTPKGVAREIEVNPREALVLAKQLINAVLGRIE